MVNDDVVMANLFGMHGKVQSRMVLQTLGKDKSLDIVI